MTARKHEYFEVTEGKYCLVPDKEMPSYIQALEVCNFLNLDKNAKTLSFLVKFYRFKMDLSKVQLAQKAQLSRHTITNIEDNPKHAVDIETVKALSRFFSKELNDHSFENAVIELGYKW